MVSTRIDLQPLSIGDITIETPLTLAPMAGHTDYALRTLCRDQGGCGLVCTEFMSSKHLADDHSRQQSLNRFDWHPDEKPIAVQLFGSDPLDMAEAARIVVDHGADIVDINMGCWVPKVAKKGAGAALLRDVCTATAVVEAVVKAVDVPVTVKVRSGFEDGVMTAVPFAKAAEQCGVKAVAVHARYAGQGHQGPADWDVIRQVKEAVSEMLIIGNGDVRNGPDAVRMFEETGCDAVMIGRASLGQPWIFHHIAHYMQTGDELAPPPRYRRAQLALEHAHRFVQHTYAHPQQTFLELRGRLSKYKLDEPGSVQIRNRLVRINSLPELEAILLPIAESNLD